MNNFVLRNVDPKKYWSPTNRTRILSSLCKIATSESFVFYSLQSNWSTRQMELIEVCLLTISFYIHQNHQKEKCGFVLASWLVLVSHFPGEPEGQLQKSNKFIFNVMNSKCLIVSINFGMKLKQNLSVMNEIEIQSNPNGTRSRLSLLDQSLLSNSSVDLHRSYLVRSI